MIFGDEVQDWSKAQWSLVKRHLADDGLFLLVGDCNQSIYSWRGADPEAMERMKTDSEAEDLPMNVSRRCPVHAVNLAKRIVPTIEATDYAENGEVLDLNEDATMAFLAQEKSALVQCRRNAPLAAWWHQCMRNGITAVIRGRDMAQDLINLIERFASAENLPMFLESLRGWEVEEVEKCEAIGPKADNRKHWLIFAIGIDHADQNPRSALEPRYQSTRRLR